MAASSSDRPSLQDLSLPNELRQQFDGLIDDIQRWRKGDVAWAEVPSSFLLYGPPGCGKTSIAKCLAGSAELHFVAASFSECQAAGALHDYYRAMNKKVAEAKSRTPSLFFIDEADSYITRGTTGGGNETYIALVVQHLLQVLSDLDNTPGVVVIGATNHVSQIDPAIRRAGRFDTHLYVGPPNRRGVQEILRRRLSTAASHLDLTAATHMLIGLSGADISTVASKAIARARRQNRALSQADLLAAVDAIISREFRENAMRIAIHEAGHAVAQWSLGLPPPESAVLSPALSCIVSPEPVPLRRIEVDRLAIVCLAGRAAEQHCYEDVSAGAEADIATATQLLLYAITKHGFTAGPPVYEPYRHDNPASWPDDLRAHIRQKMRDAEQEAAELMTAYSSIVLSVAQALYEARELGPDQLQKLLKPITRRVLPISAIVKAPTAKQSPRDASVPPDTTATS